MDAIGASTENLKKSLNQTKKSVTQSSLNSFVQLFTFNVIFFSSPLCFNLYEADVNVEVDG